MSNLSIIGFKGARGLQGRQNKHVCLIENFHGASLTLTHKCLFYYCQVILEYHECWKTPLTWLRLVVAHRVILVQNHVKICHTALKLMCG